MSDFPPPPPGSNPPPPPPPPGQQPGLQPVGPWPRFFARLIDGLVLFFPIAIIGSVIGGGLVSSGVQGFIAGIVTTALTFGYFVFMETSRGQSVGKMALGFKVIGPDGGLPTSEQSMRRNAYVLLSVIPTAIGGFLAIIAAIVIGTTIANDPFKRGWHDNFAGGTAVVRSR